MLHHILQSAISGSRTKPSRLHWKLFALKYFSLLVALILSSQSLCAQTMGNAPIDSYIVKEIGTPALLMAKDIDRSVSPASLTKILTCIMAIESGKLDQNVLITKESTLVEPSKAGFREGDRIKLLDLVKAAMVSSSNDAAFAIAIHLSGNVNAFVASMNYKAKVIGMKNSIFTNPAGFDKGIYEGNSSTAGDLMRLTEYSVKNPVFNQVARLEMVAIKEQTTGKLYALKTHNKLLNKYPYAVGIKTGYTNRAGGCLIARAIKDNKDILLVMLNARNRWDIASNMFDSAFSDSAPSWPPVVKEKKVYKALSLVKTGHKPKTQVVAALKLSHKAKKQLVVAHKSSHKVKRQLIARLKPGHRLKTQTVAALKSNHKSRKGELVSMKTVKKNKKKATLS
jgi:D-alanyl-D-alanine carboxypeptidase (penicillin-binding protein 5/6)